MQLSKMAIPLSFGLVFALAQYGCGNKEEGVELKAAARVNGQSIAASQIDAELEKVGKIPADQAQSIADRLVGKVIDQELLAQKAVQDKLDKQEDAQMKIAAARRQILAEAEIAALTKGIAEPTEVEVNAYFDAHPELFAKRSIYRLQELVAGTTPENLTAAQDIARQARSPRELVSALQAKGIPVGGREMVKGAEELPFELLAQLAPMKTGQWITTVQNGKLNMVILADIEPQPLKLEEAKPAIVRFLNNMKKRDLVEAELNKLKTTAKVEYLSPYTAPVDADKKETKP